MKRLSATVGIVLFAVAALILPSCDDKEENSSLGRQAAVEFCDCLDRGRSKNDCEKALTSKYDKWDYMSDEFIDAFNDEGESCGITASKW